MDLTSLMGALLSDNNVQSVSSKTGVSNGNVAGVLATALPMLLNGANNQAQQKETSQSFHEAVLEHSKKDPEKVDLAEGEKIVDHLLGNDADKAEKAIAKQTGLSRAQVALILAAAAPIIMNMLGKQTSASHSNSASATASLLGSLLGGGSNSNASNALMTAALGAVLSNALGGNSQSSASSSILGSVLGSALGAKPQQNHAASNGTAALLGSLLGATQQQAKPQQSNVSADLLGSLLGASQQQVKPQQQSNASADLLGGLLNLLK